MPVFQNIPNASFWKVNDLWFQRSRYLYVFQGIDQTCNTWELAHLIYLEPSAAMRKHCHASEGCGFLHRDR